MDNQPPRPPVDRLFADKLWSLETSPATDTWARLQARQATSGRVRLLGWANPLWRYGSVAACILLVLVGAWLYQLANQSTATSQTRQREPVKNQPVDRLAQTENGPSQRRPERPERIVNSHRPTDFMRDVSHIAVESISRTAPLKNNAIHRSEAQFDGLPVASYPAGRTDKAPDQPGMTELSHPIPIPERTLILTLDVSTSTPKTEIPVSQEPIALNQGTDSKVKKDGFGTLVRNLKRIKNGEAIAPNNESVEGSAPSDGRSRANRLWSSVKESISNENTMDQ